MGIRNRKETAVMYHFFVEESNIDVAGKKVIIEGGDVNHIRNVLRMRIGEEISAGVTGEDKEYRCAIAELNEDKIICDLLFVKEAGVESPAEIILYQGLPKADKMEMIIQKCVELGAFRIVPVACSRSVVKLDAKKESSKIARWQAISEAAAKQSKRSIIPEISSVISMKEAVVQAKDMDVAIIPYELAEGMEATAEVFAKISKLKEESTGNDKPKIAVFIGPEGGFTPEEVELAEENGVRPISLGKRILRTETAGLAVISWIDFCLEVQA